MDLYIRTYIIKADGNDKFLSTKMASDAKSFDVRVEYSGGKRSFSLKVDGDEISIVSAVIIANGKKIVCTVECRDSKNLQQEFFLSGMNPTYFNYEQVEKVENSQQDIQNFVARSRECPPRQFDGRACGSFGM